MKKLVFVFVAFAAISFASCGNKAANNAEEVAADSLNTEVVEEAAAVDSTAAAAVSTAAVADSTAATVE